MPTLLVVAEEADQLAARLAAAAGLSGWCVEQCDYAAASRRLCVMRRGAAVVVEPDAAMFVRLPADAPAWSDPEAQFHRAEMCSLVWAAAALSPTPVVNRPDGFGLAGRVSTCGHVLRRRAGRDAEGPEHYASDLPDGLADRAAASPATVADWWIESQTNRTVQPWTAAELRAGPYRAARVRAGFSLHTVIVVGERCFALGTIEAAASATDIGAAAVEVCRALGLCFAAVTWRCHGGEEAAVLVRVNPHPALFEIDTAWDEVAAALLAELKR